MQSELQKSAVSGDDEEAGIGDFGISTEDIRKMIAYHEAGHRVIAESFGYRVTGFFITDKAVTVRLDKQVVNHFEIVCIAMAGFFASKGYSGINAIECMRYCKKDCQVAEKAIGISKNLTKKTISDAIIMRLQNSRLHEYAAEFYSLLEVKA